jgi:hypothetical protein
MCLPGIRNDSEEAEVSEVELFIEKPEYQTNIPTNLKAKGQVCRLNPAVMSTAGTTI